MHLQHIGDADDACNRCDVPDEIEIKLLIERRADRVVGRDQQERVALCWRIDRRDAAVHSHTG